MVKLNQKQHITRRGVVKKNPDKKYLFDDLENIDGEFLGKVVMYDAKFSNTKSSGIYKNKNIVIDFNGNWDEGWFSIEKLIPPNAFSQKALNQLEDYISENHRDKYTDDVDDQGQDGEEYQPENR